MERQQKTIEYPVSCTGVGLHTGVESTITFRPAEEDSGIKFIRIYILIKTAAAEINRLVRPNNFFNNSIFYS